MNSINPEENQSDPFTSGEAEGNDLEDTRPRKISGQAAQPPAQPQPEENLLEARPAQPETPSTSPSIEDTNPVKVWRSPAPTESPAPETSGSEVPATKLAGSDISGKGAGLDETRASFVSPATAPAFDDTIPPPPGMEEPVSAATAAQKAPQPAPRPAGGKPAGKPARKKTPPGKRVPVPGLPKPKAPVASERSSKAKRPRHLSWILIPVMGLVILLMVAGASAAGGYASGIGLRIKAASTQSALAATEHFQLGLDKMAEGNFYLARQHFEYVIQLDPSFPGATDKLAETLLYLNATATPTVQPTPTLTPTPDTRAIEELYGQGQQAIQNSDWNTGIEALLSLRAKDINYRVVDVDGMLFLALRSRGREKITKADLESGIYDLSLAGNFAPLDTEAQALLTWSQMYITGASFWGLDWAQAVDYFSQIAPQMPNLMDSSRMTATERYRVALFEYGNTFARQGQFCKAVDLYQQSLAVGASAEVQSALQNAGQGCQGSQPEGSETPKPGGGGGKKKTPSPGP